MEVLLIGMGAVLLWLGGEGLLRAAVDLGRMAKLSDRAIGLCLVGFAGSAPAFALLVIAALHGKAGLAAGAVLASAILQLSGILGICAILRPVHSERRAALRAAAAFGVAALFALALCLADGSQLRGLGFVGLVLILAGLVWTLRLRGPHRGSEEQPWRAPTGIERASRTPIGLVVTFLLLGGGALYLGARLSIGAAGVIAASVGEMNEALAMGLLALSLAMPSAVAMVARALSKRGLDLGQAVAQPTYSILGGFSLVAIVGAQPLLALAPHAFALAVLAGGAGALWTYSAGLSRRDGMMLVLGGLGYGFWLAAG